MPYIKKKRDNAYLITVSCGRDSEGKKVTKSVTYRPELLTSKGNAKTEKAIEKDVAAFAADFEKKIITGQYTEGNTLTFEEYSAKYLEEYANQYQAPRTLESTNAAIRHFITDFGFMTLETLNPLFLQQYVNTLARTKKTPGKPDLLSYSSIKRRMAVLSAMLSQAVRWNLISSNPMERVQIRKAAEPEEEKDNYFNQEQSIAFLDALDNPLHYQYSARTRKDQNGKVCQIQEYQAEHQINSQLKLFFYLAIFTGCRRGELLALTWDDIDFKESSVNITKSVCRSNGQMIVKATKTKGSVRAITVPSSVISIARAWKIEQARYRLIIGSQWKGNNYIFIRWNGEMMGLETPYQAFHRIINNYNATRKDEAVILPLIPLHGLRHTAATLLIGQGVNIRTVSGRLGHSSVSTTLNIYSHALKELDRKASDTLADLLAK